LRPEKSEQRLTAVQAVRRGRGETGEHGEPFRLALDRVEIESVGSRRLEAIQLLPVSNVCDTCLLQSPPPAFQPQVC